MKIIFDSNFSDFFPKSVIDNKTSGLGNGVEPNRRQAITGTNVDSVQLLV